MSERMTVEGDALTDEHCGFCGLHYGIHPRYKSLEHLARAVARDPEAHEWLPPSTYASVKQAILDEGSKEERARVDGLVKAAAEVERSYEVMTSMGFNYGTFKRHVVPAVHDLSRALAAVRESQDEGGA